MTFGQDHVVRTLLNLGFEEVDPAKSYYAAEFADGTYPYPPVPMELAHRVLNRKTGTTLQIWARSPL
jgi:hypothetical protein